jgi:hypothetical protein
VIGVDERLPGEVAVGTRGDLLLANEHAAFVITAPGKQSTYYYYGGVPADAVAMAGCTPVSDDKLDELGVLVADINLVDPSASILRAFRGDAAEVVSDGSDGGLAHVRVTGGDATHWLLEYELNHMRSTNNWPLSEPFGVGVTVDYTLAPDSPVLVIDVTVDNPTGSDVTAGLASLLAFHDTMATHTYASSVLDLGIIALDSGVPWLVATDGQGALAYGVDSGSLAFVTIAGVWAAVDVAQLADLTIEAGTSVTRRLYLSSGPTDGPSATAPLAALNPTPLPDRSYTLQTVSGTVLDASGDPVPGATVYVEADALGGGFGVLDEARADASGAFSIGLPVFTSPWAFRLVAAAEGRHDAPAVDVAPGDAGVALVVSEAGSIRYGLTDDGGAPSPARVSLDGPNGRVDLWLAAEGEAPVPPGTYTYTATRGYAYRPVTGTIVVPDGGAADLDVVLTEVIDTAGWMSVDTHVHTSDSPDSDVSQADQLRHAAAHGLEIVVHTEHEKIVDRSAVPAEEGLELWVNNVIGEEVTSSAVEHMTTFPVVPDGSIRGGIVEWYEMDIEALFGSMRARSKGGINLLNHPGYLDRVAWDRVAAAPGLDDPTRIGLPPDAALWSWDFDGIEVLNGHASPFVGGNRRFDNWQSMVNAGHPMVAVGCSDDHGGQETGFPLTWFESSTDAPEAFVVDDLVGSFVGGRTQASTGAFARVSVNGVTGLGGLVTDEDGSVSLSVVIEAMEVIDVTHVVVFANCDQVVSLAADDPGGVVKLSETVVVPVDGDTNLVVAAFGANRLPVGMPQFDPTGVPRVLTSPVYVDADGDGLFTAPGGRECGYDLSPPG